MCGVEVAPLVEAERRATPRGSNARSVSFADTTTIVPSAVNAIWLTASRGDQIDDPHSPLIPPARSWHDRRSASTRLE